MNIARFVFNPIQENTYVVWDATGECAVIDAGNLSAREDNALVNFITEHKLRPVLALNTHGHFDHIAGVEFLRTTYDIPFAMSGKDAFLLGAAASSARMYGVEVREAPAKIDRDLDSLTEIGFGDTRFEIIATPGHTPGHVSFYEPQSKTLFTGDTLFRESIGRTDLPGGDYSWIMRSIIEKILPLGDETTIGHESLYNPFIVEVLNNEVNYRG